MSCSSTAIRDAPPRPLGSHASLEPIRNSFTSRRSAWSAPRVTASATSASWPRSTRSTRALKARVGKGPGQLKLRLVQPEYTIATSDGIRNGTREMRYSLIGRDLTNDCALRAPERDRPCRHDRGRRLRQAAGRHARGAARAQPAGDHHVGRLDPSRHRSEDGREARHRQRLSGRGAPRRRVPPPHRLPRLPRLRQLRRHVHLQHHADVHRRRRHAAAAHGGAAFRRPAQGQ